MKKYIIYSLLLSLALIQACSNKKIPIPSPPPSSISSHDTSDTLDTLDITEDINPFHNNLDTDTKKDIVKLPETSESKTINKDCIIEEWYFCPPLNAIWQFKIVKNICEEPPEILEVGECEEKFECDPSNTSKEIVDCEVDDVVGRQEKWCEKGSFQYSDCMPCVREICNAIDDDCDGEIDEEIKLATCLNECGIGELICIAGEAICMGPEPEEEICDYQDNDCDGEIDEGQLNDCNECGAVPEDICNGFDDDCDGTIDEDLYQQCTTACGTGLEYCIGGQWNNCSAKYPLPEICNGLDDDCDSLIDEGLNCLCTIMLVGVLFPCFEDPLVCGAGYKSCECVDEDCKDIALSECLASCHWQIIPVENCDPYLGVVVEEMCNNHDDNCNQLVDEDLYQECYTGPPTTLDVGICLPGEMTCYKGTWGNYYDDGTGDVFIDNLCLDEVTPEEKDACNGADDNCDGIVDDGKEMEDTDILFIVDWSGSMADEIQAVLIALNMFATNYSDKDVIKWGLLVGPEYFFPTGPGWPVEYLNLITNPVGFQQFIGQLASMSLSVQGSREMLYDAVYLSIWNLVSLSDPPWIPNQLDWKTNITYVDSTPSLGNFKITWREDAHRVIIVFTDEDGQSYLHKEVQPGNFEKGITQEELLETISYADDLNIYTFTPETFKNKVLWNGKKVGWEPLTQYAGKWYKLTNNAAIIYENLLDILDETACGE